MKIKILETVKLDGAWTIPAGSIFKMDDFNSKFVYFTMNGCTVKLSRKFVALA